MNLSRIPQLAYRISRTEGPKWLAYRMKYAARLRLGLVERQLPVMHWMDCSLADELLDPSLAMPDRYLDYRRRNAPSFLFNANDRNKCSSLLGAWDTGLENSVISEANDVLLGTLRLFAHTPIEVGTAPAWKVNPFSGKEAPGDTHWSKISDFDHGDIKAIWDLSRFSFTYSLVRAYWRTGNEDYPKRFWQLFEHWLEENRPQQGPNWKCGQETSIRLMAWCFALYGFLDARETTADRVTALARAVSVSARRVEANIEYSISQQNNHGMSEALGLWTAGSLFPEFQMAESWKKQGLELLEHQGRHLIYDDGAFSQHSVNYHRLMLHDYLWVIRLADILGSPVSDSLRSRIGQAGELLFQLQDESTGRLPCYGQNDGSLILHLSNCDYQDFRPVLQAVRYLTTGTRYYDDGPWDEELFWLFGTEARVAPVDAPVRKALHADDGGYFTFRSGDGFAFIRCASFRHRPGEADMLHVDLWWRGMNIATDAGTYSYNATQPWPNERNVLSHTRFHNTVTVDNMNQMDRVTPFLWLPWLSGTVQRRATSPDQPIGYWEGAHDGYTRLSDPVSHRRAVVQIGSEHWLVIDDLHAEQPHDYTLHWLLADLPHTTSASNLNDPAQTTVSLETNFGTYAVVAGTFDGSAITSLVRADDYSPRGWRSPYYMDREPALSLAIQQGGSSARFWTLFGPSAKDISCSSSIIRFQVEDWESKVLLNEDREGPLVKHIRLITDTGESTLEIAN